MSKQDPEAYNLTDQKILALRQEIICLNQKLIQVYNENSKLLNDIIAKNQKMIECDDNIIQKCNVIIEHYQFFTRLVDVVKTGGKIDKKLLLILMNEHGVIPSKLADEDNVSYVNQ